MNNKITLEYEVKLDKAIQAMKTATSMVKTMSNNVRATQTSFKSASNQIASFASYNKQLKSNLEGISKTLKTYRTALTKLENSEAKGGTNKQLQINAINKYKEAISVLAKEQAKQQSQLELNQRTEEEYKNAGVKNSQELINQKKKEKQAEKDLKNEARKKASEEKAAEKAALAAEKEKQQQIKETQAALTALITTIKDVAKGFANGFTAPIKAAVGLVQKLSDAFDKAIPKLKNIGISLKTKFIDKAVDYAEELNLFNVVFKNLEKDGETTFSKIGKKATQFQNKLNEAFGTNKMESMRYQGLYQSMSQSAGLSEEVAYLISENMTKLGYDLASLFNTTEKKAMESLRAGVFAGQTKPLRGYGIDVTQQTYKPVLADLGIDKKVSELSQAEKEVLRYIVAIRQASQAHGDFADTIESPANQLKVLRNQLAELSVAIGRFFIEPFQRALQVINGVIMALKELVNFFARIMGVDTSQFNAGFGYSDEYEETINDIDDIGDSASGATQKVKELQRQILGFDQINNINSPTDTGSSGGGGSSGGNYGVDPRLLAALQGYDSFMDKIKMKAVEIRDTIMSWLGFRKKVDPETSETFFAFDSDGKSTREMAREMAQNLAANLNNLLDDIDWEDLGRKLGYKIITILTGINQFIQTFDWSALGRDIADYLNGVISEIDPIELGQTLTDKLRMAILTFSGFVQEFDFGEFAHKLAGTINAAIANIPVDELINGINTLVNGIFEAIGILLKEVNWGELINDVLKIINGLDWKVKMLLIASGLASGIRALLTSTIVKSAITQSISESIVSLGGSGGLAGIFTAAKGAATKLLPVLGKVAVALGGAVAVGKGSYDMYDVTKDVVKGNKKADYSIEDVGKAATLTTAGGAAIGTLFAPGIGTAIGALVGSIAALVSEIKGYNDALEEIAYENVFGTLSVSMEEWREKISTTIPPIQDLGSAFEELQSKQNYMYEDMQSGIEMIENLAGHFNVSAERLQGEEGTAFLDALTNVTETSKQIIKDSGDYNFSTMQDMFNNYSVLTEEEEKDILKKILDSNDEKLKSIDEHNAAILKIQKKAKKDGRELNDQELKDIQKHLKAINDLTVSEMTQNQSEIEFLKKKAIDNNGRLDEESYKRFNKAIEDYYNEQMDIISRNYNTQYNALKKNKDDKIISEEQYSKQLKAIGDQRIVDESKLATQIEMYRDGVYDHLITEYESTIGQTDKLSKKEKELLENTFNNLNIDTSKLNTQMSSAGSTAGKKFSESFNSNVKTNLKSVTVKIPSDLQENTNLKSSYSLKLAAKGGVFSKGSLILAGEMGSEIVGNVNGRTEVMNQSQIAETIYRAVKSAMKESDFGGGVDIQLHTDEGVIVDRINKITRQTGTCPINI